MSCLNAKTGALAWRERLPAAGNYFASLVAANGNVYALSEEGQATVVAAKPQFQLISSNDLGERTMASPAVSGGRIFIRSDSSLFCIGGPGRLTSDSLRFQGGEQRGANGGDGRGD